MRGALAVLLALGACQGGPIDADEKALAGGAGDDGPAGAPHAAPATGAEGCTISPPIQIQTDGTSSVAPTLAWNGSGFGLLFSELGGIGGCDSSGWRFVRLDGQGCRIGAETSVADGGKFWEPGGLGWIGDGYVATLVLPPGRVQFSKLDMTGAVIGMPRDIPSNATSHSLVWTGTDFGLVWGTRFQRIDTNGDPLTPEVTLPTSDLVRMSRAGDGFALSWGGYWTPKYHQRLAWDGMPIGGQGATCAASEEVTFIGGAPAVTGTGNGSMTLCADTSQNPRPLTLTVFDETGTSVEETTVAVPSRTTHPVLAHGSGEVAAAWIGGPSGAFDVYFARFDEAGTQIQQDTLVTEDFEFLGCAENDAISLIPTPNGYALAFAGGAAEGYEIYFTTVACTLGEPLGDCSDPLSISCPAPITVECNAPGGVAAVDASVAPWRASATTTGGCEGVVITDDSPALFSASCDGDGTVVTFTATDGCANTAACTSTVTVLDTVPPSVSASLTQACLWSPNHQFVDVGDYAVADTCDSDTTVELAVCGDEAPASEVGAGGAAHCPDAELGEHSIRLRAERSGMIDNGRVYTSVTVTATDSCGNHASASLPSGTIPGCPGVVCVPHDQNPKTPGQTGGNDAGGECGAIPDLPSWDAMSCDPEVVYP